MKKITILLSLAGVFFTGIVFAQTATDVAVLNAQAVQQAESITTEDLGVKDPGMLPTNPFYFLKEFKRAVQQTFTFNSVSKAELQLNITNEKAAEAKKMQETVPNDNKAITKAIENYTNSQEKLKVRIELLKEDSQNDQVGKLMDSMANQVVIHQKMLDEIGTKAGDNAEVKAALTNAKDSVNNSAVVATQKDNSENFIVKLEKALLDSRGSELKHIRSVEIIDGIEKNAPQDLQPILNRLREDFSGRLAENIKEASQTFGSTAVQETLKQIPGDASRKAVILDELKQSVGQTALQAVSKASQSLTKDAQNEGDITEKAKRQISYVEELLRGLEQKISQDKTADISVKPNLDVAQKNLQRAKEAFAIAKYGEALGQANSAEVIVRQSIQLIKGDISQSQDWKQQISELRAKISSYAEMLGSRNITADSNPKAYAVLAEAKKHAQEAEDALIKDDKQDIKTHIQESRNALSQIFRFIDQSGVKAITPTPSIKVSDSAATSITTTIPRSLSVCDQLKASLEKLTAELKAGNLTEEQYKTKYEAIKKELEQCINKQQSQPTTTIPVQKETPVSNCEFLKKYPSDLEAMLKKGEISEKDYSAKLETIKKELEKCSNQPVSTGTTKPIQGVFCTQEAKLCSDGSYVGRTGPNCEFAKCPEESSNSISKFNSAYWQCYDSKESKSSGSCKSSEEWQAEAKKFCDGHCYADNSKCGVNTFSVSSECKNEEQVAVPPTTNIAIPSTPVVIEDCGKENEKVNRNPLLGPVNKPCCFGLKENRESKSYSVCYKPGENIVGDTTTSSSVPPINLELKEQVKCVFNSNILQKCYDGATRFGCSGVGTCVADVVGKIDEKITWKSSCGGYVYTIIDGNNKYANFVCSETVCPTFVQPSPEEEKSCAEKGGNLLIERDKDGCSLPGFRCILSSIPNIIPISIPATQ